MAEIPHGHGRRQDLTQHRGHCRAHHAPAESIDKHRVQNDIYSGPGKAGGHGEFRAAVRPNHRVHGLAEHIKRNAQRNIKEILLGVPKRLLVDPSAEEGQDPILKNQVNCRQDQAQHHAQHHCAADALMGVFVALGPQTDADIGAAAVPDHNRNGQRHHRQREHHRVGSVAERTKVAGVGNEDLIHDVVQGSHQQGDHAGNRVLPHQRPQLFLNQKSVVFFHKRILLTRKMCKKITGHKPRVSICKQQKTRGLQLDLRSYATRCSFIIQHFSQNANAFFHKYVVDSICTFPANRVK